MKAAQALVQDGEILPAVRVDDWPNPSPVLKTVVIHTDDFVGTIVIEASLYATPSDDDWFDLHSEEFTKAGQMERKSRNRFFNSRDRVIWMRAKIVKEYGRVDRIKVR